MGVATTRATVGTAWIQNASGASAMRTQNPTNGKRQPESGGEHEGE